jgi:hypothetical protein
MGRDWWEMGKIIGLSNKREENILLLKQMSSILSSRKSISDKTEAIDLKIKSLSQQLETLTDKYKFSCPNCDTDLTDYLKGFI